MVRSRVQAGNMIILIRTFAVYFQCVPHSWDSKEIAAARLATQADCAGPLTDSARVQALLRPQARQGDARRHLPRRRCGVRVHGKLRNDDRRRGQAGARRGEPGLQPRLHPCSASNA